MLYNNLPGVLMAAEAASPWADQTADHATNVPTGEPPAAYFDEHLSLALRLDQAIRDKAPAGWKGDPAREAQVLNAIFPIIKNQPGY